MNELVFRNANGVPMTNSWLVAETFGKHHRNVLRDIENLECSESFQVLNFEQMFKIRELPNGGQTQDRYYNITKDGFTFLAMGYTGKKAAEFKEKYIAAFNAMEQQVRQGLQLSSDFMQTQMQMMNQMMQLCNSMMQRIDRLEKVQQESKKAETKKRVPELSPLDPFLDDRYPWTGVITTYQRLRKLYPNHITVPRTAKVLRRRGISIRQQTIYRYLREEGFISSDDRTYHRPSRQCVEKGWMICTQSGRISEYPNRRYHTPHLSPDFVDMLEHQFEARKYRLLEFGKEVQQ